MTILTWLHAQMTALTVRFPAQPFTHSDRFLRLDRQQDETTPDRSYVITMPQGQPDGPQFGRGEVQRQVTYAVRVKYVRPSGTASEADLEANSARAALDMIRISDRICNPLNYDAANTAIVEVRGRGWSIVAQGVDAEVWQVAFDIQWRDTVIV